ncbi:MAG: hypothetical protein HYU51_04240 [Candidatus Rokubacteria bacterium]|nr:hypothetical protein [Candidatus Rokubacteria bacterium]
MRALRLAIVALLVPLAAFAADQRLDGLVAAVNQAGAAKTTEAATVTSIARALGVAPDALRMEQARAGLQWGDLFVAHRIATHRGHPIDKVFSARKTGASWKDIASDAQVDQGRLEHDLLAAFPNLTPVEVPPFSPAPTPAPPVAPPPASAPPEKPAAASDRPAAPAPEPEKKPGIAERFRDLFRGEPAGKSSTDRPSRHDEEIQDFIRGKSRPR